ncbi:MAG: hypothetical protein LBE91_22215 [Tannerella sp.]|jgi:Leucine-rich repeat (LRR) protein|nr:hypothetical protein [Tannerella sp.]
MTTKASGEVWITLLNSGYGDITIDWGDGTIKTYPHDRKISGSYNHNYSDSSGHTVTIRGFNIIYLELMDLRLTHLDVSKCKTLNSLDCRSNRLTNLDVSQNTMLQYLACFNNKLTNLDVSRNIALLELECSMNQLTDIDVSQNTVLTDFNCSYNQLIDIDVSQNTALRNFTCADNQLTRLDISNNTALSHLNCWQNQLQADALDDILRKLMLSRHATMTPPPQFGVQTELT